MTADISCGIGSDRTQTVIETAPFHWDLGGAGLSARNIATTAVTGHSRWLGSSGRDMVSIFSVVRGRVMVSIFYVVKQQRQGYG